MKRNESIRIAINTHKMCRKLSAVSPVAVDRSSDSALVSFVAGSSATSSRNGRIIATVFPFRSEIYAIET